MRIRGHELGTQALRAADGLPETARAYAFAKCTLHRIDICARAVSQHGGVFSRINESSVRARDDQINLAFTKLRENFRQRVARLALFAEICSGRDLFKANGTAAAEQDRARSLAQDRSSWRLLEGFDRGR